MALVEALINLDRAVQNSDSSRIGKLETFYRNRVSYVRSAFGIDTTPYDALVEIIKSDEVGDI